MTMYSKNIKMKIKTTRSNSTRSNSIRSNSTSPHIQLVIKVCSCSRPCEARRLFCTAAAVQPGGTRDELAAVQFQLLSERRAGEHRPQLPAAHDRRAPHVRLHHRGRNSNACPALHEAPERRPDGDIRLPEPHPVAHCKGGLQHAIVNCVFAFRFCSPFATQPDGGAAKAPALLHPRDVAVFRSLKVLALGRTLTNQRKYDAKELERNRPWIASIIRSSTR